MILLPLLPFLGMIGLAAAAGCLFGLICAWHPGRPGSGGGKATSGEPARPGRPGSLPVAGYLDLGPNTGCYQPRLDWPEPDWAAAGTTYSEISAGWDRLERNVIAETQPFGKVRP